MDRSTIKPALAAAAIFSLSACGAMPHHFETRKDVVSTLVFDEGPEGALVEIDGKQVATLLNAKTIVPVPDGTHSLIVSYNGRTLYQQTIFIEDGSRKIIRFSAN